MNFAFISRHQPTAEQSALAAEQGITLHAIGDTDAFTITNNFIHQKAVELNTSFEGVIVVHPAAALRLCSEFVIGILKTPVVQNRENLYSSPLKHYTCSTCATSTFPRSRSNERLPRRAFNLRPHPRNPRSNHNE